MRIFKIAKDTGHEHSWVYIDLPKEMCTLMKEFGEKIDSDDLFVGEADGGKETDFHITVKYGLTTNDVADVKGRLEKEKGGSVHIGSSSIFEVDEYDVVKVTVESEDLLRIHTKLNELPHEDSHPDYQAHATLAYVKSGTGKKYKGKFHINKDFNFNEVFFGDLNGKDHKIKLK